jgi:hypothetical protein
MSGTADGKFDPQDTLTFYGQRFYGERLAELYASDADHWITFTQQLTDGQSVPWHPTVTPLTMEKYTNDNVYWLEVGSSPGQSISQIDGKPAGSTDPTPLYFEKTVHVKKGGCDKCYYYYWLEVVDNNSSSTFVGARQSRLRRWQFMPIVNK